MNEILNNKETLALVKENLPHICKLIRTTLVVGLIYEAMKKGYNIKCDMEKNTFGFYKE